MWRLQKQLDGLLSKEDEFNEMFDCGSQLLKLVQCKTIHQDLFEFQNNWNLRYSDAKQALKWFINHFLKTVLI